MIRSSGPLPVDLTGEFGVRCFDYLQGRTVAITRTEFKHFLHRQRRPVTALLLLVALTPFFRFATFALIPPGNGRQETIVELKKGVPLRRFADQLQARGLVSSARLFVVYARIHGDDAKLKAGYYQFTNGMCPAEILGKMVAGDIYLRLFVLPPGYSTYQVAEILEKRRIFTKENFLKACRDRNFLDGLGIHADSAEGYLCPGTYNILPGLTERDVLKEMIGRQRQLLSSRFADHLKGGSAREVLTLASIVEKEAVLTAEKPLIASVFQNRLRRGMPLQSDPTAVYGVRAFPGKVSKADILRETPYNTYRIPGLPPGPIGNPGPDAIEAVFDHLSTPYLYFVARGDGSHYFSVTLAQHNEAVRRYLRGTP